MIDFGYDLDYGGQFYVGKDPRGGIVLSVHQLDLARSTAGTLFVDYLFTTENAHRLAHALATLLDEDDEETTP